MTTRVFQDDPTIERHLGRAQEAPVVATESPLSMTIPEGRGDVDPSYALQGSYTQQLALMLHDLLKRYVDLLESPDHGGWSRTEDQTVQSVRFLLAQAEGGVLRSRSEPPH